MVFQFANCNQLPCRVSAPQQGRPAQDSNVGEQWPDFSCAQFLADGGVKIGELCQNQIIKMDHKQGQDVVNDLRNFGNVQMSSHMKMYHNTCRSLLC